MNIWLLILWLPFNLFGAEGAEIWNQAIGDVKTEHLRRELPFHWSKDPFLKASGRSIPASAPAQFTLSAVLFDKERPIALINGIAVEKGDSLAGKTVLEVGRNYVVLEENHSLLELVIPPKTAVAAPEVRK